MEKKYIEVKNIKEEDLKLALSNLANLYRETGFTDGIQLYRSLKNKESYLIIFKNMPDFDRFAYFVNYIRYPEGFEQINPEVIGYSNVNDFPRKLESNENEWLMIYVPENDEEYDNVYVTTQNNIFIKYDFGGKVIPLNGVEKLFTREDFTKEDFEFIIEISPSIVVRKTSDKPWWKIW